MKIEYLLFNLVILIFSSLGALLYPNAQWPKLKPALLATAIIGSIFLIWDQVVTNRWWFFNDTYTLGVDIGTLPVEEWLFFCSIPWSCLIIWENLKQRVSGNTTVNIELVLLLSSSALLPFSLLLSWWYTATVLVGSITVSVISLFLGKWLRQKAAWFFLGLVVILTLVFNGYLTARPVVTYNPDVKSNINLGTVPIEDVFYGLVLVGGVVILYEYQLRRSL